MKERGILFSAPMVRALLDGTKTQTRRVANTGLYAIDARTHGDETAARELANLVTKCPHGLAGDRLYVRETFGEVYDWCDHPEMPGAPTERWHIEWKYRADGEPDRPHLDGAWTGWKPSIHMPRTASRILLEIVSVRVERLQEISEADAAAEGWQRRPEMSDDPEVHADAARDWYCDLWEQINGAGSWAANPWVWAIEFKRVD